MKRPRSNPGRSPELERAYRVCREIARREARNFYYSFLVLPQHKSDAMCAIYAFMRKADDLADDESLTLDQRREAMAEWTTALRRARTQPTDDPIFLAVNDTQRNFGIADDLLDKLVEGTTLDLRERVPGISEVIVREKGGERTLQVYETFDALYDYCYLVASVVGLVCIRIFGYSDAQAEVLAEHTGVAFQLTNILRDVREDLERGRVYLPMDDMQTARLTVPAFVQGVQAGQPTPEALALLNAEIARAENLYRSADELIPLLDRDAREAMRVLAGIYRRLLERIAREPSAVFHERVSVPATQKIGLLMRGVVKGLLARRSA